MASLNMYGPYTLSKEEIDKIEQKIQDVIHTGKLEELREFCDKI